MIMAVVGERCECGHKRLQHRNKKIASVVRGGVVVIEKGHGSCRVKVCNCPRFTWAGFIYKEMNDVTKRLSKKKAGRTARTY